MAKLETAFLNLRLSGKLQYQLASKPNLFRQTKTAGYFVAAPTDFGSAAGARIPSLCGRCRNLFAGSRAYSASAVVSCWAPIFPVARQPYPISQPDCIFAACNAPADGVWFICVACCIGFLASSRVLGVVWLVFFERASAVGRRLPDCGAADDSSRGHSALHHGSVFKPAESSGVCGRVRVDADLAEKICAGAFVDNICGVRASSDVGVSGLVLRFAGGAGATNRTMEECGCCSACKLFVFLEASCAGHFRCVSRGRKGAWFSLHSQMGVV